MPDPHTLAALRTLVSAWSPPPRRAGTGVSTGIRALDDALDGGLPAGRLTELVSPPGTGGQTVLAQLLGAVRAMPRPQQAWKAATPTTDNTTIGSQSPLYPASTTWQYSNLGLTLVGETVEAVPIAAGL